MQAPEKPTDSDWMQLALIQAQRAQALGEVPVGAVVVRHGQLLAVGHNAPIGGNDPTAHAEIVALRDAAQQLGNYRLEDCELFVTLEPCAMCAGAILHARLRRVVYGAPDPKAGAAGSVTDLFALAPLNHQTQVAGGVLAEACSALLQDFFRRQRHAQRQDRAQTGRALRDDALRTPERCFADLPPLPASSYYLSDLPSLSGLRMHYVDTGPADAISSCLFLHGPDDWSLVWRDRLAHGRLPQTRWVCPDLIGFGRSDKPKKESWHSLPWHARVLAELMTRLALQQVTLVVAPAMAGLAQTLIHLSPERIAGIVTEQPEPLDSQALAAPFPDRGHQAAPRAFAALLPAPTSSVYLTGPVRTGDQP